MNGQNGQQIPVIGNFGKKVGFYTQPDSLPGPSEVLFLHSQKSPQNELHFPFVTPGNKLPVIFGG